MSSVEDVAKKYLDEIGTFVPVSSVVSMIIGVVLLADVNANGDGASIWLRVLFEQFSKYWYLRDLIFGFENWQLVVIFFCSLLGPVLTKFLATALVVKGCVSSNDRLSAVYSRALKIGERAAFSSAEIDAAQKWKAMRFNAVWGMYKLAALSLSLSLISIFGIILSGSFFDLLPVILLAAVGVASAFYFSVRYVTAYLPERILFDASLGLINPRMTEDL